MKNIKLNNINDIIEKNINKSNKKKEKKLNDKLNDYFASFSTIFIILKSIDGYGLLITPYLFSKTTLYLSCLSFIISIILLISSSKLIAEISIKTRFNGETFHNFISHLLGNKFGLLFFLLLLILEFFYSFCYLIFSYKFLNFLFCIWEIYLCNDLKLITFYFVFICLLLIIRKKIRYLLYFISFISSFAIILFSISIWFKNFNYIRKKTYYNIYKYKNRNEFNSKYFNFFLLIGINFFSFKNIGVLISNQRTNNLKNTGLKTYSISLFILGLFYFIFSYITSTVFKYELKEIIFFNITYNKDLFLFILELIYGFGIILFTILNDLSFFSILKDSYYIKYLFLKFRLRKIQIIFIKSIFKYFFLLIFFILIIILQNKFLHLIIIIGSFYGLIFVIIIPLLLYIYIIDYEKIFKINFYFIIFGLIILWISVIFSIKIFF